MTFLVILITFKSILDHVLKFLENLGSQDGGPRWSPFRNVSNCLHHVTSTSNGADQKDKFLGILYILPVSFIKKILIGAHTV